MNIQSPLRPEDWLWGLAVGKRWRRKIVGRSPTSCWSTAKITHPTCFTTKSKLLSCSYFWSLLYQSSVAKTALKIVISQSVWEIWRQRSRLCRHCRVADEPDQYPLQNQIYTHQWTNHRNKVLTFTNVLDLCCHINYLQLCWNIDSTVTTGESDENVSPKYTYYIYISYYTNHNMNCDKSFKIVQDILFNSHLHLKILYNLFAACDHSQCMNQFSTYL